MKKILLFLFIFLPFIVSAQFRMVGTASWTTLNDSTYQASISFQSDLTGMGYLATQIVDTFRLFTPTEKIYRVDSVWNKTFSSASVRIVEMLGTQGVPVGQVMVFNPDGRNTIPNVPFGSTGGTAQMNAAVDAWNARQIADDTDNQDAPNIPLAPAIDFGGNNTTDVQEALEAIDLRLDTAMNAQPAGQIAYGNAGGTGLTSNANLTADATRITAKSVGSETWPIRILNTSSGFDGLEFRFDNGSNTATNQEIGVINFVPRYGGAIGNEVAVIVGQYTGTGTSRTGDLYFATSESQGNFIEGLRLKQGRTTLLQPQGGASARVGVGTSTPTSLFHVSLASAATNTVIYPNTLEAISSGTAANGFGVGKQILLENSAGVQKTAASTEVVWTDATNASEDADFVVKLMDAGSAAAEKFRVDSDGNIKAAAGWKDTSGDLGSSGNILSSTGTGTDWIASTSLADGNLRYTDDAFSTLVATGTAKTGDQGVARKTGAIHYYNGTNWNTKSKLENGNDAVTVASDVATPFTFDATLNTRTYFQPSATANDSVGPVSNLSSANPGVIYKICFENLTGSSDTIVGWHNSYILEDGSQPADVILANGDYRCYEFTTEVVNSAYKLVYHGSALGNVAATADISSGTWTPTLTPFAASPTDTIINTYDGRYTRVGNIVTYDVTFDYAFGTNTGAGSFGVGISLPIASDFTNTFNDGGGTMTARSLSGAGGGIPVFYGLEANADTSNDRISAGGGMTYPVITSNNVTDGINAWSYPNNRWRFHVTGSYIIK